MHFSAETEPTFLAVFKANEGAIRNFPGCRSMELYRDQDQPHTYSTISYWRGPADLAAYRESKLFGEVWAVVRPLMVSKPLAFTLAEGID